MDNAEAKRRWREKNATRAKGIPVNIPGVGEVYVRQLKVADGDACMALANSTDETRKPQSWPVCSATEDGTTPDAGGKEGMDRNL